jgi:hypothetical protein
MGLLPILSVPCCFPLFASEMLGNGVEQAVRGMTSIHALGPTRAATRQAAALSGNVLLN